MDTIVLCTVIIQEVNKKYDSKITKIQKELNISKRVVYEKAAADIFEKCNKFLNIKIVNYYVKNLKFMNILNGRKILMKL